MSGITTILLWTVVAIVAVLAASRSSLLLRQGARDGALDFLRTLPRIMLGVIGSGYLAAIMPQDLIISSIGPETGWLGISIGIVAGALTPGGAVIGFAIAATALRSGAGAPQIVGYLTAWALYCFPRIISFEIPSMPPRSVWLRAGVSLPLPFLAALGAVLLGKP